MTGCFREGHPFQPISEARTKVPGKCFRSKNEVSAERRTCPGLQKALSQATPSCLEKHPLGSPLGCVSIKKCFLLSMYTSVYGHMGTATFKKTEYNIFLSISHGDMMEEKIPFLEYKVIYWSKKKKVK